MSPSRICSSPGSRSERARPSRRRRTALPSEVVSSLIAPSPGELSGLPLKDRLLRAFNTRFEIGIPHGTRLDEVDRTTERLFQRFSESEVGVERMLRRTAVEFDQKIDVAVLGIEVAARGRAK